MPVENSKRTSPDLIEEEMRRLRRSVEELSILNDLAHAIGGLMDPQEVMKVIIHRSVHAIQAEQGVITMVDEESGDPMRTLVRTMVNKSVRNPYHFNNALLGWMQLHRVPIQLNTPREDPRFQGVPWDDSIRSLLCVPLMVKGEVRGVLTVYNKKTAGGFTMDDQRLLSIIAAQSAQVIENARLYESERALLRMKEEVRLAARIQADFLPQVLPSVPGYEVAGRTIPAQVVGGDYFDFIPMEGNCLGVCLGDASGKGLPASLLMANVQATLRSQSLVNSPPKLTIERANKLLLQSTGPEKFVTLFYAVLDATHHSLTYVNAGHEFPYLLTKAPEPTRLSTGGTPLSITENVPFEEHTIALEPDDTLIIFSDGVTEAMNTEQGQFGQSRLEALLLQCRNTPASTILERIVAAVKQHTGTAPQHDDITVVAVRRLPV